MLRLVRSLPTTVEFATVITIAFGSFIYYSIQDYLSAPAAGVSDPAAQSYWSDAALIGLVINELFLLAIVAVFLRLRGWTLGDFDFQVTWRLSGVGVLLFVANYAVYYSLYPVVVGTSLALFGSDLGMGSNLAFSDADTAAMSISLFAILLLCVVNPVFEEVLVVGYVMTVVQRRFGMWLAINVSTVIRLSYHLYQGPIVLLSIVPLGLIFGYWYARTGKLWPLILAHAIMDFIPFYWA